MGIIQAVLALISRSLGRVAGALFGWAVEAHFGTTSGAEKVQLSMLVGAAAAWPILVLGIVWPKAIALVLAFIPIPAFVPSWTVRLGWLVLAVAVPFAVGIAMATRARGSGSPLPGTPGPASAHAAWRIQAEALAPRRADDARHRGVVRGRVRERPRAADRRVHSPLDRHPRAAGDGCSGVPRRGG